MHIEYKTKVDLSRQLQNLEKKVNYIQKNDKLKQVLVKAKKSEWT